MFTIQNIIVTLVLFLKLCHGTKLPPYFSQCSKSDPNLSDCITANAKHGLHSFVKGDKHYNIQKLLPLFVPYIHLHVDKNLKMNLTNSVFTEMDGAKVGEAKLDLNEKHFEITVFLPRTTLLGQYSIKGKISILPINERGPVNITVVNNKIKYDFDYELTERKGKHYINITNSAMTYKTERSYFVFYNLFSGTPFLGATINQSLNENWFETNQDVEPALSDALGDITTMVLQGFFEKVPFEELLGE